MPILIDKNDLKYWKGPKPRILANGNGVVELPVSDHLPGGPDSWSDQRVLYCGHRGWFEADVFITPFAILVRAKNKVTADALKRTQLDTARWHITDTKGGYFGPMQKTFVLPREALTIVTPENRELFL